MIVIYSSIFMIKTTYIKYKNNKIIQDLTHNFDEFYITSIESL